MFHRENVEIAFYNQKKVRNLFEKLKDPIPTLQKSNVVYDIVCEDCHKTYIERTFQWLKCRISLHKSGITKHHERCALATHPFNLHHRMNFENVKILKTIRNYHNRLILEMIEINKQENIINKKNRYK